MQERTTTRRVMREGEETVAETAHTRVVGYKFADKLAALGLLCKCLRLGTSIPALEVLLATLPPDAAAQQREVTAGGAKGV